MTTLSNLSVEDLVSAYADTASDAERQLICQELADRFRRADAARGIHYTVDVDYVDKARKTLSLLSKL
jgi:hypothetical protein